MPAHWIGDRTDALSEEDRRQAQKRYKTAKILVVAALLLILVPLYVVMAVYPPTFTPSERNILIREIWMVFLVPGIVLLGIVVAMIARLNSALSRAQVDPS